MGTMDQAPMAGNDAATGGPSPRLLRAGDSGGPVVLLLLRDGDPRDGEPLLEGS